MPRPSLALGGGGEAAWGGGCPEEEAAGCGSMLETCCVLWLQMSSAGNEVQSAGQHEGYTHVVQGQCCNVARIRHRMIGDQGREYSSGSGWFCQLAGGGQEIT